MDQIGIFILITLIHFDSYSDSITRELCTFTINDQIIDVEALRVSLSVPSQIFIRGWFRWKNALHYKDYSWLADSSQQKGIIFGGGGTFSAIYPNENNLTEEQFKDFVTSTPDGNLLNTFGWYHGSLENPRWRDYLLSFIYQQIDAGAGHIFIDEPDGAYFLIEGFDKYNLNAFRAFLINKYSVQRNWATDDHRWFDTFGINLTDTNICPDQKITSFNYRAYLKKKGFIFNPWDANNPLSEEWSLFLTESRSRILQEYVGKIRKYSESIGKKVLISTNGINNFVDFQIFGLDRSYLMLDQYGHVNASASQLSRWRAVVLQSNVILGKEVPVVFFHDWGQDFPWAQISNADKKLWLEKYAMEIFAAGGFFAFPVLSPWNHDEENDSIIQVIRKLLTFINTNSTVYALKYPRVMLESDEIEYPEGISITCFFQQSFNRLLIHLVNNEFDRRYHIISAQKNFEIKINKPIKPKKIYLLSPQLERQIDINFEKYQDRVCMKIPHLETYAVIVIELSEVPLWEADHTIYILTKYQWARPVKTVFKLSDQSVILNNLPNAFIHGKYNRKLSRDLIFDLEFSKSSIFSFFIRSVAVLSAYLEVYLDDKIVLKKELKDRDGKNDCTSLEYGKLINVKIPAGRHILMIRNRGEDWFTIDFFSIRPTALNHR